MLTLLQKNETETVEEFLESLRTQYTYFFLYLLFALPDEEKADKGGTEYHELLSKGRLGLLHHPVKVILKRYKVK